MAVAVAGLVGCGPQVSVQPLNPAPHPMAARSAGEVEIYMTAIPTRPYVEVAVLNASRGQSDDHLPALRERAAAMGCDALVFTSMSHTSESSAFINGKYATEETVSGSTATCAVWNDAGGPGPPGAQ